MSSLTSEIKDHKLRWTKTGTAILSVFWVVLFLIGYVWWPLLEEYISQFNPEISIWQQIDWLLIGNFMVMSVLITLNADLKHDLPFVLIALCGGFFIETWGTQSGLWTYYTFETPPLWIIPAWPIAALSVNRLNMFFLKWTRKIPDSLFQWAYWPTFGVFILLLIRFTWITLGHPMTMISLIISFALIFTGKDRRSTLLILIFGSVLGYFLERWGTTRLCWAYYTGGMPPFFTVLAHGMASVAIWRVYLIYESLILAVKDHFHLSKPSRKKYSQ